MVIDVDPQRLLRGRGKAPPASGDDDESHDESEFEHRLSR
jgi:hypothetical protein